MSPATNLAPYPERLHVIGEDFIAYYSFLNGISDWDDVWYAWAYRPSQMFEQIAMVHVFVRKEDRWVLVWYANAVITAGEIERMKRYTRELLNRHE